MKSNISELKSMNDYAIGEYVIIRTYSAGVWFGKLAKKERDEVILEDARRMYYWWCLKGISLSSIALYGINREKSRICGAVESVWLQAIEIIPVDKTAIESIKDAEEAEQS